MDSEELNLGSIFFKFNILHNRSIYKLFSISMFGKK